MTENTLAGRMRARRLELGLTQAAVAKRADMVPHDICRLETGITLRPRAETVATIALALETTTDYLIMGRDSTVAKAED